MIDFLVYVIVGSFFNDICIRKKFNINVGIFDFFKIILWDFLYLNSVFIIIVIKVIIVLIMEIYVVSVVVGVFKNLVLNILEFIGFIIFIYLFIGCFLFFY